MNYFFNIAVTLNTILFITILIGVCAENTAHKYGTKVAEAVMNVAANVFVTIVLFDVLAAAVLIGKYLL